MALSDIDNLPTTPVHEGDPNHDGLHDLIHTGLKSLKTFVTDLVAINLRKTTDQTISGQKIFSSSPVLEVDDPLAGTSMINRGYVEAKFNPKNAKLDAAATAPTTKYFRGDKTWVVLDKTQIQLTLADNTSDVDKPVSNSMQTALNGKQNNIIATDSTYYYRGDKNWVFLDKDAAGLDQLNNTSDALKPISTLTQAALNDVLDDSDSLKTTVNQTISAVKTFTSVPKLIGTSTVGHVWTATDTAGTGQWQVKGTPVTTADWAIISSKPSTYPPTIGTTLSTAAAGNHTHVFGDFGLDQINNTADLAKPISTATQTALNSKAPKSRTISNGTGITGGGDLNADRTLSLSVGGVNVDELDIISRREGLTYVVTFNTRKVGLGDYTLGVPVPYKCNVVSVKYRMGTADASGTTTAELRKNGVTVSGTSQNATLAPTPTTGTWAFAKDDILTVYVSAIGTGPGKRLTADIILEKVKE